MTIKKMVRISLFTSLICVFTIIIPPFHIIPGVPVTLQTLIIMMAAVLLKPREAFLSVLLYLLLGIIGVPVFSGFNSGLGVLLGPTGGFLLSFPFAAWLISYFKGNKTFIRLVTLNIVFGIIFVYMWGILSFSIVNKLTIWSSVKAMLLFIPFDLAKAVIASLIGIQLLKVNILTD